MTDRFTEEELAALEDPDEWEWETADVHEPSLKGSTLTVHLEPGDIGRIERCAQSMGLSTLEFVRIAVLGYVSAHENAGKRAQSGAA